MQIERLRVEYLTAPLGLDVAHPRFCWIATSDRRADVQTAYRVQVGTAPGSADLWDSGQVASAATAHVAYAGADLPADTTCWWQVRAWDRDGAEGPWSEPASWTTGVGEWVATWIAPPASVRTVAGLPEGVHGGGVEHAAVTWLRGTVDLAAPADRAHAFVTARGVYELHVNGTRVGDDVLSPGWTDYGARIQYQVYDVAALLRPGANEVAVLLADGWFSGRVAWQDHLYGDRPSALVQVHATLSDGSSVRVGSDGSWTAAPSHVRWSDMLTGEEQDLTVGAAPPGDGWVTVEAEPTPGAVLVGQRGPTVRRIRLLPAASVEETSRGTWLVDLGQNIVGRLRLSFAAGAGQRVEVRHAEVLDGDALYTQNYRAADCVDVFHLPAAEEAVTVEAHFTWRGFRYAEVSGIAPGRAAPEVTGVVLGSAIEEVGSFTCSSPMVTRLQRNIEWGQRGNFLDVPTDCPQRDERLGWMGDAQVFLPTAAWNGDVAAFFTKWLDDVLDARSPNGGFSDVAPVVRRDLFAEAAPAWGDAGVIVPWTLYERYGDVRLLAHCFDAMVAWVDLIAGANPDHLWRHGRRNDYGDWLSVGEDTPHDVLSTAYFARSTELTARAARVLGRDADAERLEALHADIVAAFGEAYVAPSGRIVGHTQTTYVLALAFDLVPEAQRSGAAAALVDLIEEPRGFQATFAPGHLATGFLGVGLLLPVLTETGRLDLAYRLLENESFPSWGYSIANGATTIWERWDGWTEDKGFQKASMNSFNHYSLGSVGHWLFATVAGLDPLPEAPGLTSVRIRPRPGGSLTWARAQHDALTGRFAVAWSLDDATLDVTVPTNVTAEVWVPGAACASLCEGGAPVASAVGVEPLRDEDGCAVVRVGGGSYTFSG